MTITSWFQVITMDNNRITKSFREWPSQVQCDFVAKIISVPKKAKGYTNFGIQFRHSSIQIVDLFDFVALKSFFHVFDPPGGDFEKIIDKYCFCYMYYFVAIKEGCIKMMHIWKMVKKIFFHWKTLIFLWKFVFSLLVRISCRNFIINKKSLFFQLKERWDHPSILITTLLSWVILFLTKIINIFTFLVFVI